MKKLIAFMIVFFLAFAVACVCTGCKQSPVCSQCDRHVTPIHRVISGSEEYYLCTDCCTYGFSFGAFYYDFLGSCYFCKNEAQCELTPAQEQEDEYTCFMLVCDTCKDYKKQHGKWPE